MTKLGQHFLRNAGVLRKIAVLVSPQPEETILEIGPGHGELTQYLVESAEQRAERSVRIIAVERDPELAEFMRRRFKNKIEVLAGNVLQILPALSSKLGAQSYKLCGNIPYYLTGYLLRTIGELPRKPELAVLTMQKEVAERLTAKPPEMNRLSAAVQFWAEPRIAGLISRRDFYPPPEVDSATVVLKTRRPEASAAETAAYYRAVRAIFRQPRKTLLNNLLAAGAFRRTELDPELSKLGFRAGLRPQDLSVENIRKLAEALADKLR